MKVDFNNTEIAFKNKSNFELKKASLLFGSLAYPTLVHVFKSLTSFSLAVHLPIKGIIKSTVYKQFVGGESIEDCHDQIANLESQNVKAVLDYSSEGKESEADFDYTMKITLDTNIYATKNSDVPFSVFKPSGLGRVDLYEKVSLKKELTDAENEEWKNVRKRYYTIAEKAKETGIPVMVDAEETWTQQAIDDLVTELMEKYNKETALIYNTTQMYRWDRLEYIKNAIAHARENGYKYGLKTVRGAYLEKERERAEKMGYKDPMQPNKEATDRDFDAATELLIANNDICSAMIASHNAESMQVCIDSLEKHGLAKDDPRVYMAQLFGMSDNLSMNIGHAGYNVVKYLPFGPIKDVMPYLFRRAEENTSVKGQTGRELQLIKEELERRGN